MRFLHSEIVRYKCKLLIKSYFLNPRPFKNMNAYGSISFLGKAVILGACCGICLYMLQLLYMCALMLILRYHHKAFVNIDIIGLNVIMSDIHRTNVAVSFSKRCIANLSLVYAKYSSEINNNITQKRI